ncbi:hypothetical protein [Halomicronema sp. CCY15110]|uniref:hypothetical protein n=1 Tax=Halomicronema sp. CCY15110 TaxID=2767773 RepID=UPI00194F105A|nr:hypothetical protein [Halomicronema sp. CCY15110]
MQHSAVLFHKVVVIMFRRIISLAVLLLLGVGLVGFDGCDLSPTMQEVPDAEEVEASSADELTEALELAQEYNGLVTYSTEGEFQVCFDNEELARQYTRRVNQATETLFALRDNLCVTVVADS